MNWGHYIGKRVGIFSRLSAPSGGCFDAVVRGVGPEGLFAECVNEEKGQRGVLFFPWTSVAYISLVSRDEIAQRLIEGGEELGGSVDAKTRNVD